MLRIGITGGMGTGKSTVCKIFASLNIAILNMDELSKTIIQTDKKIQHQLQQQFGEDVFKDNVLDKKILAKRAFITKEKTAVLNSIIHPAVIAAAQIWQNNQSGIYCLQESALSIESGSYKNLDYLIGVTSPTALRLSRIVARDNCTQQQALDRINLQMKEEEKLPYYQFVINNNKEHLLIPQVLHIHHQLLAVK
jgi:dephospho-CoA kinase